MDSYSEHPSEFDLASAQAVAAGDDVTGAIGADERRMHVRAYNYWVSLLDGRDYPSIEDLEPGSIGDFAPNSVLLDFTAGRDNPATPYVGTAIRAECGLPDDIKQIAEVPSRSLLSRLTDHYMQIIANRAPIGFEAEFLNARGNNTMYRGILLPFSADDDTIDFIYGVINWKEGADSTVTEALELEVQQALAASPPRTEHVPVWADGPTTGNLEDIADDDTLTLGKDFVAEEPQPDENSSLADWLHAARISAEGARDSDLRTREVLYQAIGRAHDFALVAQRDAEDYAELLSDSGLKQQDRAPFTPIVKLVFGAAYDKTRLTEFATALQYADRNAVPMGGLAEILANYDGGLKGIVAAERRARKVASGQHVAATPADPRPRLRAARARDLSEFAGSGEEFVLLVARREADGSIAIVGSVEGDASLTDKALHKAA